MRIHNSSLVNHIASSTRNHSLMKSQTARPAETSASQPGMASTRKHVDEKQMAAHEARSVQPHAATRSQTINKGPASADWSATGPSPIIECGPYTPADPAAPTKASDAQTTQSLTLDGLLAAWGHRDSIYDLTGNGVVDTDDLLAFINNLPAPSAPAGPTLTIENEVPPTPQVGFEPENQLTFESEAKPADGPTISFDQEEPLTLKGLLNDWGQPNSGYDLNNDGTVDVDDLLNYINNLNSPTIPQQAVAGADSTKNDFIDSLNVRSNERHLADSLIDRLAGAGFDRQPPTNIRELVDQLKLSPKDRQQTFERLSARYPRGLGLNMVG